MVMENHAECKTAVLGLLDALGRIKILVEQNSGSANVLSAIKQVAADAVDRHSPILPRM